MLDKAFLLLQEPRYLIGFLALVTVALTMLLVPTKHTRPWVGLLNFVLGLTGLIVLALHEDGSLSEGFLHDVRYGAFIFGGIVLGITAATYTRGFSAWAWRASKLAVITITVLSIALAMGWYFKLPPF